MPVLFRILYTIGSVPYTLCNNVLGSIERLEDGVVAAAAVVAVADCPDCGCECGVLQYGHKHLVVVVLLLVSCLEEELVEAAR